jgi:serine/threonine protein kinase
VQLAGADQATVASYVNEISLLQKLRGQEHIVTLFEAHVDRGHGYIYMVRT